MAAVGHAPAGPQPLTVSQVLRDHADETVRRHGASWRQRYALRALIGCRTAALGGHLQVCPGCDHRQPVYNSCFNRHCPQCLDSRRAEWISRRTERTLPVGHFQVVFPLPKELRPIAMAHPEVVYDLLFQVGSYVLQTLASERLGAQLAAFGVLHTWTREMNYHPHVHFVVSAGGLSADGSRWAPTRPKFLFPVAVMRRMYRGRMLDELRKLQQAGVIEARLPKEALYRKEWVVHVTAPDDRPPEQMLKYLGRYVYGVAISDHRLASYDGRKVVFRTRNGATLGLSGIEFTRRFLLHVLPKGFRKVRYYGLYAPASVARLGTAFARLGATLPATRRPEPAVQAEEADAAEIEVELAPARPLPLCPACGKHALERRPLPMGSASARAPPWW